MDGTNLIAGGICLFIGAFALYSANKAREKNHWLYKRVHGIGVALVISGIAVIAINLYLMYHGN